MRKIVFFILFSVICVIGISQILGDTFILNFEGHPGLDQVLIKWTTRNEVNLKGFEILRSRDKNNPIDYKKVTFVKAKDEIKIEKEYEYKDKSVFKQLDRSYYYKLNIIRQDNSSTLFPKIITVTPTISSARQTWGSIKAMFR